MDAVKFIDNINTLLQFHDLYYETENEICFDCIINKQFKFNKELLDEMKNLEILITDEERYTKVQRLKGKTYRCMVINKRKFRSLERIILLGAEGNGKIPERNI